MTRRPPRSTLFPTRRSSDLQAAHDEHGRVVAAVVLQHPSRRALERSEEHTSELQSRSDLVCRLLLEKKMPTEASVFPSGLKASELMISVCPVKVAISWLVFR